MVKASISSAFIVNPQPACTRVTVVILCVCSVLVYKTVLINAQSTVSQGWHGLDMISRGVSSGVHYSAVTGSATLNIGVLDNS